MERQSFCSVEKIKIINGDYMNKRKNIIEYLPFNICYLIGTLLTAAMFVCCLFFKVSIANDSSEHVTLGFYKINFLIAGIVVILLILKSNNILSKFDAYKLFKICAVIYVAFGMFLIFNTKSSLKADAGVVYGIAQGFIDKQYTMDKIGRYLFQHQHQLGLAVYESLLLRIYNSERIIYIANLIYIVITNYFILKISECIFENNELINKYTVIASFLFIPQMFFILFAYGQVPGMCFSVITAYLSIKYLKQGDIKYICGSILFAIFAVLVRNNFMIFIIAVISMAILHFIKNKSKRSIFLIVALCGVLLFSNKILIDCFESLTSTEMPDGEPKTSYIAMGLQEGSRGPGWYNGYNYVVYEESGYNKEIANEIAKEEIMAKINNFIENPKYTIWFFSTKFISTWCEPTYQSIWSGPIDNTGELVNTKFLKSMYSSGTAFDVTVSICNIIVVNILFFALANNIIRFKNKSNNIYEILPLIFLIGGALFHLVWETKSQYVYVYILFLIPFAAKGLYDIQILVKNNKNIFK